MSTISLSELSSANCDLQDVIESIRRRVGRSVLEETKNFLDSLYPADCAEEYEGFTETEIDPVNLKRCIDQVESFARSLDEQAKKEPKDNEDSSSTVGDCLEEVLGFLRSL